MTNSINFPKEKTAMEERILGEANSFGKTVGCVAGAVAFGGFIVAGSSLLMAAAGMTAIGGIAMKTAQLFTKNKLPSQLLQYDKRKKEAEFVRSVIAVNPESAKYIPEVLKDREMFFIANKLFRQEFQDNPQMIQHASERLRNDEKFMKAAIKLDPSLLQYASADLRNKEEFIITLAKENIACLKHADPELLNKPQFIQKLLLQDVDSLTKDVDLLKSEIEQMKAEKKDNAKLITEKIIRKTEELTEKETALSENLTATQAIVEEVLKAAGPSVLRNNELMTAIAKRFPKEAYKAADKSLYESPEFMLPIILDDIRILSKVNPSILADQKTMIAIANQHPDKAYEVASDEIKSSANFMLPIVLSNIERLTEIDSKHSILKDREAMIAIAKKYPQEAYGMAKGSLIKDPDFMEWVLKDNVKLLSDEEISEISPELLKNKTLIKSIMLHNAQNIDVISKSTHEVLHKTYIEIRRSTEDMAELAKKHPKEICAIASLEMKKRPSFYKALVTEDPESVLLIPEDLRTNDSVIAELIKSNPRVFTHLSPEQQKNQSLILKVLEKSGSDLFFEHIDAALKTDKKFIKKAVKINGNVLKYADSSLTQDTEYVKDILIQNAGDPREDQMKEIFSHIDSTLKEDRDFLLSIKNIKGVLSLTIEDKICKNALKNEFFTKKELIKVAAEKPEIIKTLGLDVITPYNREKIVDIVSAHPELIKKIKGVDESLLEDIARNNCDVLGVFHSLLNETDIESQNLRELLKNFLSSPDFFRDMAPSQPSILRFLTTAIRIAPTEFPGLVKELIDDLIKQKKGDLTLLEHFSSNENKDVQKALGLGTSVKATKEVFKSLAETHGNEVYRYADDSIRKREGSLFSRRYVAK